MKELLFIVMCFLFAAGWGCMSVGANNSNMLLLVSGVIVFGLGILTNVLIKYIKQHEDDKD